MITLAHVFTVHHDQVLNTENVGGEDITLERHAVAVATVDVHNGLHTLLLHQHASGQGTHTHDAVVHIGDYYCIHPAFDPARIGNQPGYVYPFGSMHLGQDHKFICLQSLLKTHTLSLSPDISIID